MLRFPGARRLIGISLERVASSAEWMEKAIRTFGSASSNVYT